MGRSLALRLTTDALSKRIKRSDFQARRLLPGLSITPRLVDYSQACRLLAALSWWGCCQIQYQKPRAYRHKKEKEMHDRCAIPFVLCAVRYKISARHKKKVYRRALIVPIRVYLCHAKSRSSNKVSASNMKRVVNRAQ